MSICDTLLDESSTPEALRKALNAFSATCSEISGIEPGPSFSGWAEDALLSSGVAINAQAAAHCVQDYQRSVMFIRGVYAAITALKLRFDDSPIEILYAGCGPFATLLLPLLGEFAPGELSITLLDIHQESLDSAEILLEYFGFSAHAVKTVQGDACLYKHPRQLHLVIAETMQKALEQEPQFAVTANLAPQLVPQGVFIPQRIEVSLALADLEQEASFYGSQITGNTVSAEDRPSRHAIAVLGSLSADSATTQSLAAQYNEHTGKLELAPVMVEIPPVDNLVSLNAALFTRIAIFKRYSLDDYEAEITLPLRCYELEPLHAGERYRVSYQLGSYPKFNFERLD